MALLLALYAAYAYVGPGSGVLELCGPFALIGAVIVLVRHSIRAVTEPWLRWTGKR